MKHLADLDEAALAAAQECPDTATIKDTVNAALDVWAGIDPLARESLWR